MSIPGEIPKKCEHHYQLKETKKTRPQRGHNELPTPWMRIDIYYCTKCLKEEMVKQVGYPEEYPGEPDWW